VLSEPVIKRLTLSRFLFELAAQNARSQQDTAASACVHLLQDAIEVFFLAAFDNLDVPVSGRTEFPQYLDKLSEKLGYELPFRRRLLEINRVRVHSKHEGIPPHGKEIAGYVTDARKFLEETCQRALKVDYWTISLIDLLDDGEEKALLHGAEKLRQEGQHLESLTEARKAFFLAFETPYDLKKDLESNGLLIFGSSAPYFARNKEWIDKNVKTPFDYIFLDHSAIDAELMKEGIETTTFWNVWRLTPQVYRHTKAEQWRVKHELSKQNPDGIEDRSAYVVASVTSMLLQRQSNRSRMRDGLYGSYEINVKKKGVVVYQKADKNGPVSGTIPDDINVVHITYATDGLTDDDVYWSSFCYKEKTDTQPFFMLSGYILQDDLDFKK